MLSFFKKKQPKTPSLGTSTFKSTHPLAERMKKKDTLKLKYPQDKFCVLVIEGLLELPTNNKFSKPFLLMGMERTMNVLHLIGYIKKILSINQVNSLFVEAGGSVVGMTTTMEELCQKYTEADGFIYIRIKNQDSF